MEKTKNYREVSPERAKVWKEKSPKHNYNNQQQPQHIQKVPIVYYLCRNRKLEHPHFMEVPLSSSEGLYLRDMTERLDALRGRGMASMYSWSCKRSYKSGYVWHDLCDDDLILPSHGNEYVLKGSELFEESNSGNFSPVETDILHNQKALPELPSSRNQEESSSSSSLNGMTSKTSQGDELSPSDQRPCSAPVSPECSTGKNSSWNGTLSLAEYKVYKSDGLADASTQTEDNSSQDSRARDTCMRGVSTDDGLVEPESSGICPTQVPRVKATPEICRDTVSPPPSTSSASSSSGRTDTLESLIRTDARKLNSFRILEEEEFRMPSNSKLKASNMILQLLSCGSISVKDHSFGLIPTYRPRFSHSKFPSPLFSTSLILGELDCAAEKPRFMGMTLEDKENFSGSLIIERNMMKQGVPNLKRSSSLNADQSTEKLDSSEDREGGGSTLTKCIPRSMKVSLSKQPRCESMRSSVSDGSRMSSDRVESSQISTPLSSIGGSKRITQPLSGKKLPNKLDSSRNQDQNVIKIEERLASGARVIIQSKVSCDGEDSS